MAQNPLIENQYKNSNNINIRIKLHEKFSQNPVGFHEWAFANMHFMSGQSVLECGCGPAALWYKNKQAIPSNFKATLIDLSEGMLADAKNSLDGWGHAFTFQPGDIQQLPFESNAFDCVIANHMLYHVPDKVAAIREVRRVLKPEGKFFASTFGKNHLREIDRIVERFIELPKSRTSDSFTLENGFEMINNEFRTTELIRHLDSLIVTEAEPLISYVLSNSKTRIKFDDQSIEAFKSYVKALIREEGAIKIRKEAGMFVSTKLD